MTPLPQRLAFQVGLVFCVIAATLGLSADLGVATVVMRSVLCGVAGAGIGGAIGGLILWMGRIAADIPELPAEEADPVEALLPAEAVAAPEALSAAETPALSEGQPGG